MSYIFFFPTMKVLGEHFACKMFQSCSSPYENRVWSHLQCFNICLKWLDSLLVKQT